MGLIDELKQETDALRQKYHQQAMMTATRPARLELLRPEIAPPFDIDTLEPEDNPRASFFGNVKSMRNR